MPRPLLTVPAPLIVHAHTVFACSAFLLAFLLAAAFHYKEVCKNGIAGWPEEWLPSVSATIGDHIPSRPTFQILIACTSGPRFLLILLQWLVTRRSAPAPSNPGKEKPGGGVRRGGMGLAGWVALIGVVRTFTCGGWVYVTSTDQHDFHDLSMLAYMVLTIPWMFGTIALTPKEEKGVLRWRYYTAGGFFTTIIPLVHYFTQHKSGVVGAYSMYAIFEWGLVFWDVLFDSLGVGALSRLQLQVIYLDGQDGGSNGHIPDSTDANAFGLSGSSILPAVVDANVDTRMELSAYEGGWSTAKEEKGATNRGERYVKMGVGRRAVAHLSDMYLAFCFWTIFTELPIQLFYFSVWKLALSGSELALLSLLAPFLLQNPKVSRFATSRKGQLQLRLVSIVCGLAAYKIPSPAVRLLSVCGATVAAMMGVTGHWGRLHGAVDAKTEGATLLLGLLLSLPIKFANNSTNPLWVIVDEASGGWNKTGIVVALLATLERHFRPIEDDPVPAPAPASHPKEIDKAQVLIALGFGALVSLVQTVLMDAGTVIAWTWTGYPVKGPVLLEHFPIVVASAATGLATSFLLDLTADLPQVLRKPTSSSWSLLGCAACFAFTVYLDWLGFVGGSGLVFYLALVFPSYARAISYGDTPLKLGYAMALVIALDVLSVLTVAYAFVPAGQYLRERTDLVMAFSIGMICLGNWTIAQHSINEVAQPQSARSKSKSRLSCAILLAIVVSSVGLSSWIQPLKEVVPYRPATGAFTGGIWTVHFGVDLAGRDSQERMLDLIRNAQVDVIGLLETDLHRFVYGNRDLTRKISEELGYYVDLGPGPNMHTWGAALLSKFPILESTHHLLPSPHGELAPAIHARLLIHEEVVDVIVSHNGQEEDALDRQLQSEALARIMRSCEGPVVFLGYLVTDVGAHRPAPYEIIMADGGMWDVEIEDRRRWCEYIAFRDLYRTAYAKISEGSITDTELQVATFVIPSKGSPVSYLSNEDLYWHVGEKSVPQAWRMAAEFTGNGTRGHRYIHFDGPIYYWPPDGFWDDAMHERFPDAPRPAPTRG